MKSLWQLDARVDTVMHGAMLVTQFFAAREGVSIDRSTLGHWVGFAAVTSIRCTRDLIETLKASPKLFCDDTRCPVLDPGRGKTTTGYLWTIARDNRPWAAPFRRLSPTLMRGRGEQPAIAGMGMDAVAARADKADESLR